MKLEFIDEEESPFRERLPYKLTTDETMVISPGERSIQLGKKQAAKVQAQRNALVAYHIIPIDEDHRVTCSQHGTIHQGDIVDCNVEMVRHNREKHGDKEYNLSVLRCY